MKDTKEVTYELKRLHKTIELLKSLRQQTEMELPIAPFKWEKVSVTPDQAIGFVAKCTAMQKQIKGMYPFIG